MHGGEIKAFNNRHAGCSFRILLPLQRNERKDEKTIIIDHNDSSATPVQDSGSPKEKEALSILVVEDNADMRGYIRSILREQYHVLEAANGEEALHILNSNPIDFIISDLMMPVMDGIPKGKGDICHFAYSFPDADRQNLTRSPTGKLSYGSGRISAETF